MKEYELNLPENQVVRVSDVSNEEEKLHIRKVGTKQIDRTLLSRYPIDELYNAMEFPWLINYSSIEKKIVNNLFHVDEDVDVKEL